MQEKKVKRHNVRKNVDIVVMIALILLLCLLHAVDTCYSLSFGVTDGVFQNYNVVRRLLDGQVPYRDFTLYLGLGHLFSGSFFTWLFGNNFAASQVAFGFLTLLSLCLFSVVIGKLILGRHSKIPYACTLLLLIILMKQPLFYKNAIGLSEPVVTALNAALSVGSSARYVRGMICPLFLIAVYQIQCIISARVNIGRLAKEHGRTITIAATGALGGAAFIWSNDYGIGSWLCSTLVFLFVICIYSPGGWKRKLREILLWLISGAAAIFVIIMLVSHGHITNWLTDTFGTGGYQSWYYGYTRSRAYYLWNVDFSFETFLLACLCIYYLGRLYLSRKKLESCVQYASLAFLSMCGFAVVNEYYLLSSNSLTEVAYAILFLLTAYEIYHLLEQILDKKEKMAGTVVCISIIAGVAAFVSSGQYRILSFARDYRGTYAEELGGYIGDIYKDLKAAKEFTGDEKVFSTYASALEVMTDQFQPSGTDYIIHVLGDKSRQEYLETFREGDFRYVTTIKETYDEWEYWARSANWFFYRELYKEYHPVWSNIYQLFWEKNEVQEPYAVENWSTEIIQEDRGKVTIRITGDSGFDGVADVLVRYASDRDGSLSSKLIWNQQVFVENVTSQHISQDAHDGWALRGIGEEYLPVTILDGSGEITLVSEPEADTVLKVEEAICQGAYTEMFDYLDIGQNVYLEDGTCRFWVESSPRNQYVTRNLSGIEIGGLLFPVYSVTEADGRIIFDLGTESIESISEILKRNNVGRIVRKGE